MFERLAKKNSAVRITVEVLSAADGVTRLSGHAAAIQSLVNAASPNGRLRRGGGQATELVTVTEQGTTGFYDVVFTPTVGSDVGELYFLAYKEPAGVGAMERIVEHAIQVFDSISVTPAGGSFFTTLANIKEFIGLTTTGADGLLANLVARATAEIQQALHRVGFQATYTELKNGKGGDQILADERPIVSVTSLHESQDQTWDSSTEIAAADFLIDKPSGIVGMKPGGWFLRGFQNVRLVYVGGFATVPPLVEQKCIELAAMKYEARKSLTTASVSLGDGSRTIQREPRLTKGMLSDLQPYSNEAFL